LVLATQNKGGITGRGTNRAVRRRVAVALVAAAAAAVIVAGAAGCGATGHVENASAGQGRDLFLRECASCHALEDAGAQGQIGPNLDHAFASVREQGFEESTIRDMVRAQIKHPVEEPPTEAPGMPANLVVGDEAEAVAAYVASVAGVPADGGGGGGGERLTEATDGETIFAQAGCGSCHTLAAAGTTGTIGPNLDQSQPDVQLVVDRVTNGMGAMPAFEGRLSEEQIQAVAEYVAENAGS
jgi:cbb3-type cytochrome c oxidase subunit III